MSERYQKILYLERPVSKRRPMAVEQRAKQFAPFAALKGFEEKIEAAGRDTHSTDQLSGDNFAVFESLC